MLYSREVWLNLTGAVSSLRRAEQQLVHLSKHDPDILLREDAKILHEQTLALRRRLEYLREVNVARRTRKCRVQDEDVSDFVKQETGE